MPVDDSPLRPWFKESGELVCFCFLHRRQALVGSRGPAVVAEVEQRVRLGECACDVRNPTGKCCLGELRRLD